MSKPIPARTLSALPVFLALSALSALAPSAARAASNCDGIQAEIADKFRAGGITEFRLSVVDMEAAVPGRVVGRCEQGTKKIVFVQDGPAQPAQAQPQTQFQTQAQAVPRPAAPPPRRQEIITECRDGTVAADGECPR